LEDILSCLDRSNNIDLCHKIQNLLYNISSSDNSSISIVFLLDSLFPVAYRTTFCIKYAMEIVNDTGKMMRILWIDIAITRTKARWSEESSNHFQNILIWLYSLLSHVLSPRRLLVLLSQTSLRLLILL